MEFEEKSLHFDIEVADLIIKVSSVIYYRPLFPLSCFFSANQRFCWAHAD